MKQCAKWIIILMVINMTLLETRKKYGVSQSDVATLLKVPLRTYIRYEKDNSYGDELKRQMMINSINEKYEITEEKGILSIGFIKDELTKLFQSQYKDVVNFCYLFGSYAKGYANEKSDVDLCVSSSLTGIKIAGLAESIRNVLHKHIDLIRVDTLNGNIELLNEIMKDGIKIYG